MSIFSLFGKKRPTENRRRVSSPAIAMNVEPLETRLMLAGVVNVSVSNNGNVTLSGDNASNDISLTTNADGDLLVSGTNDTQIRFGNSTASEQTISLNGTGQVRRDLVLRMKSGDDNVAIQNLDIAGTLNANMSSGNDTFQVSFMDANSIRFVGSSGDDTVGLTSVDVSREVSINLGSASDGTDRLDVTLSTVGSSLNAKGSSGSTDIYVNSTTVVGEANISTGSGNDHVEFLDSNLRSARIRTASGDDDVVFGLTDFTGRIEANLSSGNDSIAFSGPTTAASASFNGAGGEDRLEFSFFLTAGVISNNRIETIF